MPKISLVDSPIEQVKPGLHAQTISAFIDGEKVGYITYDYTSREIMNAEVTNIYSYASHWSGEYFGDSIDGKHLTEMTDAEIEGIMKGIFVYVFGNGYRGSSEQHAAHEIAKRSTQASIEYLEYIQHESMTLIKLKEHWDEYIKHASKPFVSFVNVTPNSRHGVKKDSSRQGIGTILYLAAAKKIYEEGLANGIYASTLQSEQAKGIWGFFQRKGWVTRNRKRIYLDARKIAANK